MKKLAMVLAWCLAIFGAAGCQESAPAPAEAPPAKAKKCDVSLDGLQGEWVKTVPTPQGDALDERDRVKFYTEGGTAKALVTQGTIDKRVFVLSEKRPRDVIYLQERDPETIAKVKAENKDPNYRLQGKMYVRVNEQRCQVQINLTYITYVDGQLAEPQTGMAVNYARTGKPYSWENCTEPLALKYSDAPVDPSKMGPPGRGDKPLLRAIPAGQKAYFSVFVPQAQMKEGCTSTFDVFDEDVRVSEGLTTVVAGKGGQVFLFDRTFEPYATGRYIEVHRFETCGAEKKLASVACGVVKPE